MKRKLILLISIILLIVISACKKQEENIVENNSTETAVIEEKEVVEDSTNTTTVEVDIEIDDKNKVVEIYSEEQQKLIDEIKNSEYNPRIVNLKGLKEFKVSDIEKTAGIPLSEPYYNDVITDYNYNIISDEQKVKKACEYLLKLNRKIDMFSMEFNYEEFPKYFYFIAFHNYLMESLDSVKDADVKNSKMYHLAYVLGHLARNGLYEYEKIKEHVAYLKDYPLSQLKTDTNTQEAYEELASNIHKLIGILNEQNYSADKIGIDAIYKKAVENDITDSILFAVGYLDIFNSNTEVFTSTSVAGSGRYGSVSVLAKEFDSKIFNEYLSVFSKNYQSLDEEVKRIYSEEFASYVTENTASSRVIYKLFPYNKNVYIMRPDDYELATYDLFLFTLENIDIGGKVDGLDRTMFIKNNSSSNASDNFEAKKGDLSKLEVYNEIESDELLKETPKAIFNKDGKFDYDKFRDYVDKFIEYKGYTQSRYANYYKFDANNDGKDELLLILAVESGGTYINTYFLFLVDEKTLEIDDKSELGKLLMYFSSDINLSEKKPLNKAFKKYNIKSDVDDETIKNSIYNNFEPYLYTYEGKNRILLGNDIYVDILFEKDNVDIEIYKSKTYNIQPKFVWNGELENGKPVGLLNTDASFDMSKASTPSELAIVSDVNLRMLDRLSSDKYFKSVENVNENTKKNLLNKRRQMNKDIKDCKGDYKCIRDILYIDVFVNK